MRERQGVAALDAGWIDPEIIEVQAGHHLGENEIVRLDGVCGRNTD